MSRIELPSTGGPWQGRISRPSRAAKKDKDKPKISRPREAVKKEIDEPPLDDMARDAGTSFASLLFYGLPRQNRDRHGRRIVSLPVTSPVPQDGVPTRPPPPAVAVPAKVPAPETNKAPEAEKAPEPASAAAPAEPEKGAAWTQADDETLMKMKADRKTWAQIGEAIKGRGKNELRERYKELLEKQGGDAKAADAAKSMASNAEGKETGKKGKGKEGKGVGKAGDEGKGKHKVIDGPPDNGRPKIYFDEKDGLGIEDVRPLALSIMLMKTLFALSEQYQARKWAYVSSKFFDKTGKRVDPETLRKKLGGS
ncbi:MAG: hypothetical protein Q9191_006248 [Dirinaria sp. TL-2023a]